MINQTTFERLVSAIASKLRILEDLGQPITTDLIDNKIDELATEYKDVPNFQLEQSDTSRLKFHVGSMFNVRVGEQSVSLHNPDLPRWFDSQKAQITWAHWSAYEQMLESQARPPKIIKANEKVIDEILDYSGDPRTPGSWARKGLVMGNVQSGKTQNYIGLINKAIDCGYKTVILLGGHLNDLRRQTQERVDEGVLGRKSKHLANASTERPTPIGVGIHRQNSINTGTTTVGDFNKPFADRLGFSLKGSDPVIFTVKKHTGVMKRLYEWIRDYHFLNPDIGKKLEGPLLLIDDEADYASINTKHHKKEVTKTNDYIRQLLSLFHRNTYVGYTATPFANIFIDPDDQSFSEGDDLFPSDFMIKIPVPDNYVGQDHFFGKDSPPEADSEAPQLGPASPTVSITDYPPIYELKKDDSIREIPESLKDAVRAFLIVIAVRTLRGERFAHNTMLVNISHLKVHQNRLEHLISAYHDELSSALEAYSGLGMKDARKSPALSAIEETFKKRFDVPESYADIFGVIREASGRVKVWAINQSRSSDGRELDYSIHKAHGLCAIVIGGHKLSRGLTLEGLSISYFARNSKAYDTLMQMCRWFGYRPNYKDLCRVYIPAESINWYAFISSAIRELYQELDLMSKREQRPKDFGLKVREHPGAMVITARNKIGWSDTEVRSQDLWGQVQRRFRFRPDHEVNRRNLEYTRAFIKQLQDSRRSTAEIVRDEDSGAVVFTNVDYSQLIEFITEIDLPEDDLGNAALINHLEKMREEGLGPAKVALFNQRSSRITTWENDLPSDGDRNFLNSRYQLLDDLSVQLAKRRMTISNTGSVYEVKSVHLGNPDDEKLFLTPEERTSVLSQKSTKPVSFDYLSTEGRDFPGLIIYLFGVAVTPKTVALEDSEKEKLVLGHGRNPTIGFTVSIPRAENMKDKTREEIAKIIKATKHSYRVSKIYDQLRELAPYEEYEDDDDE